jgi:hypothetical protein
MMAGMPERMLSGKMPRIPRMAAFRARLSMVPAAYLSPGEVGRPPGGPSE